MGIKNGNILHSIVVVVLLSVGTFSLHTLWKLITFRGVWGQHSDDWMKHNGFKRGRDGFAINVKTNKFESTKRYYSDD